MTDRLKEWLTSNGGSFHEDASFEKTPYGSRVVATKDIGPNATIVTCPFSLAITPDTIRKNMGAAINLEGWADRQLMVTYIVLHNIIQDKDTKAKYGLKYDAYLDSLPTTDQLRTPLHFTPEELEQFKGSNLYGATLDRQNEWKLQWETWRKVLDPSLQEGYTWERFLTAATWISSRAFPSTILSEKPTLQSTPESTPVLIPGVDSLNHARAHPISWVSSNDAISLVQHNATPSGAELFNNYGPKPNSELILGYGFSIEDNPEDSIVLKLGGGSTGRHEVGRETSGYTALWQDVLGTVCNADDDDAGASYEDALEAAQVLAEMVQSLIDRLPPTKAGSERMEMRPEVATMLHDYITGQRVILQNLLDFSVGKEREAVEEAKEQGVELVFEEE